MKLGVCRADITPQIGGHLYGYNDTLVSESINDNLTATIFCFEDGNTRGIMISATVCLINTQLSDSIREKISALTGIDKGNILLSATHTHSGPNVAGSVGWGDIDTEYCDTVFVPRIVEAAVKASENMTAVKVGKASGESLVGINRRELNDRNEVMLGQQKWGVFNPTMTVLSFKGESGEVIANLIHYGAHGTAAGICSAVSRDWSGIMTDALESETGGITAFFNGPEGDVGPRLSNGLTVGNMDFVQEIGEKAARDAVRIYKTIDIYKDASIVSYEKEINIPLSKRLTIEEAKEKLSFYEGKTVNIDGQKCRYYEDVIRSYKDGYEDVESIAIPQAVLRIGDTVFVTTPFELFSEIGMRINKLYQAADVLSLAVTNGSEGYFVTEDQIIRGGYEVDMYLTARLQPYAENADFAFVKETLRNIGG